jgi:methionyl aminopeptidase
MLALVRHARLPPPFRTLARLKVDPPLGYPVFQYRSRVTLASEPEKSRDKVLEVPDFGSYSVILPDEPFVFGVSHIKPRTVPPGIVRPPYVGAPKGAPHDGDPWSGNGIIALGSPEETQLRDAARLAKEVLAHAGSLVKVSMCLCHHQAPLAKLPQVGVTTDQIDNVIHALILSQGAYPSPLLYSGFPKSCCTSVNNILTHGIPDG